MTVVNQVEEARLKVSCLHNPAYYKDPEAVLVWRAHREPPVLGVVRVETDSDNSVFLLLWTWVSFWSYENSL